MYREIFQEFKRYKENFYSPTPKYHLSLLQHKRRAFRNSKRNAGKNWKMAFVGEPEEVNILQAADNNDVSPGPSQQEVSGVARGGTVWDSAPRAPLNGVWEEPQRGRA